MGEQSQVNARVITVKGADSINGTASSISDHLVTIHSSGFIPPGTMVETVLFFDEPRRVDGRVLWSIAQYERNNMIYSMGISVEGEHLLA